MLVGWPPSSWLHISQRSAAEGARTNLRRTSNGLECEFPLTARPSGTPVNSRGAAALSCSICSGTKPAFSAAPSITECDQVGRRLIQARLHQIFQRLRRATAAVARSHGGEAGLHRPGRSATPPPHRMRRRRLPSLSSARGNACLQAQRVEPVEDQQARRPVRRGPASESVRGPVRPCRGRFRGRVPSPRRAGPSPARSVPARRFAGSGRLSTRSCRATLRCCRASLEVGVSGHLRNFLLRPQASRPNIGECRVSRTLPPPSYMCTPQGRHGSKLRTARMMSMPLNLSRPFSSKIGVFCTASS